MYGARLPGYPVSLVNPDASTTAERRAIADLKADNTDPAATPAAVKGFKTYGKRWLHITIQLPDVGTSLDWSLWTRDGVSGLWCLDTRLGTAGVVTLTAADTDNPQRNLVEIDGVDEVYVQINNSAGVFTAGVNVWLAGSGQVDNG